MLDHVCGMCSACSEPFAFNFSVSEVGRTECTTGQKPLREISTAGSDSIHQSREIPVIPFHRQLLDHVSTLTYPIPGSTGLSLYYINTETLYEAVTELKTHSKPKAIFRSPLQDDDETSIPTGLDSILQLLGSQHTDLIPGVYEGGMKVWECAFDLINYMSECGMELSGKHVMELGCGAGLPAIYALIKGADVVRFQDFNSEVIHTLTIPNVLLNVKMKMKTEKQTSKSDHEKMGMITNCKFYSGDWSQFTKLITSRSNSTHDIILTSETIYSATAQSKLLSALKRLINPEVGVVLVAAKSYYFGVGGSLVSFKELVDGDGFFQWKECRVIGSAVPRKIVELRPSFLSKT